MISAFGHISGGHFNPAVTVGMLAANQIPGARALAYLVAQLAGAVAAAWLLTVVIPQPVWTMVRLGTPTVVGAISVTQALLLEGILTFFLVTAVLGTAVDPQGSWHAVAGFGIGTVLLACILVGGFFTGGCLNPARAFGPALVSGTFQHHLVYWLGPLSGGLVAALLYTKVFLRSSRRT
jgi:MIP family channel proteins